MNFFDLILMNIIASSVKHLEQVTLAYTKINQYQRQIIMNDNNDKLVLMLFNHKVCSPLH